MGIHNSRLKGRKLKIQNLPENVVQTKSDGAIQSGRYLSSDVDYVGNLHAFHFIKKHLFQSNFSSPIKERLIQGGCKILDVACGSGTWLLDMSTNYENSHFVGLDFQAIYPQEIKPPNLNFIEADILDGLPFPDNEFDFVHQDTMISVLQKNQWEFVLPELVRVTKPGGYIELTETIRMFNSYGPIMQKIFKSFNSFLLKQGVDLNVIINDLETMLGSQQNITKVCRDERTYIVGPNGGKIGLACHENLVDFCSVEMTVQILSSEIGISKEDFKNMIGNGLSDELKKTKPSFTTFRIWTQKR
ncbi:11493_t:CDS:2 [Funneliformis geosporum]|uniref:15175_t:CDS:1 n=1 Tax=Funneliformis geosporum TaxID=1117311 RepID=A0A9W4SPI3_9GLOM|nr:15175_t:CDS:2 [Funneliformis geosporum]CAI2179581.1 11493_t:CDS:2 [Funneliformis geosporum]